MDSTEVIIVLCVVSIAFIVGAYVSEHTDWKFLPKFGSATSPPVLVTPSIPSVSESAVVVTTGPPSNESRKPVRTVKPQRTRSAFFA